MTKTIKVNCGKCGEPKANQRAIKFRALVYDYFGNNKFIYYSTPKIPDYLSNYIYFDSQYTNLNDVTGTEIYEGDIVRFLLWKDEKNIEDTVTRGVSAVIRNKKEAKWEIIWKKETYDLTVIREIEIIGNIWNDFRLLQVKNKP